MKKFVVATLAMTVSVCVVCAQTTKEVIKDRKQTEKFTEKELNERAIKLARKAAKDYAQEGWIVAPGHLPLEKQLDKSYQMQYEVDEVGYPRYIMGEAISVGQNYDAAKMQALELAKLNLAGQVQTEVTTLIESSVANSQLSNDEAVSIVESVEASKNLISQKLGRVIPVVECYRSTKNKNIEVRVMVFYNSQMAMEATKSAVRESLTEKGEKLHEQLDKALGF